VEERGGFGLAFRSSTYASINNQSHSRNGHVRSAQRLCGSLVFEKHHPPIHNLHMGMSNPQQAIHFAPRETFVGSLNTHVNPPSPLTTNASFGHRLSTQRYTKKVVMQDIRRPKRPFAVRIFGEIHLLSAKSNKV